MDSEVKGIMFFKSYFDAAKQLPPEQRLQFYDAIFKYAFEDVETELNGVLAIMFPLVREYLNNSMLQAKQRKKAIDSRWAKSKDEPKQDVDTAVYTTVDTTVSCEKKRKEEKGKEEKGKEEEYNPPVSPLQGEQDAYSANLEEQKKRKRGKNAKQPEPDFSESHLSGAAQAAVRKWLDYKVQKFGKRGEYTAIGMQTLIKQTQNAVDTYGEGPVIELIDTAIAALWQGIAWDRLERKDYRGANIMPIRSKPQEKPENSTFGDAELEAMRVIQESMRC